jgi:hypothetical protein
MTRLLITLGLALCGAAVQAQSLSPTEARAIAKEAYIWGFPVVDSYRIQYSYFVDADDPEYKGAWNEVHNTARVYTPEDRAIQTPNSDTPYSFVGVDLRAEPVVISVPEVEPGRYYSAQFIDMYTFNFAYVGSRTTGNGAGDYLLAGPDWQGETPAGIDAVFRSETQFAFIIFRTQLFGPDDLENVKAVQAGYKAQPLSAFLGQPPVVVPPVDFVEPLSASDERTSLRFFDELNFLLKFMPAHPSEVEFRERFARLGIAPGLRFDPDALSPDIGQAVLDGITNAWADYGVTHEALGAGKISSSQMVGSREFLERNYLYRMTVAADGIYGNSKEEAFYPAYFVDADGRPFDGSNRYTLRFPAGALPPVRAFWSLTLYEMPASLLYANPLDRYLINSSMVPELVNDADGGITIYIQHDSPGPDREANWLPAPVGPFVMGMRLYWPEPQALDGTWQAPPAVRVD